MHRSDLERAQIARRHPGEARPPAPRRTEPQGAEGHDAEGPECSPAAPRHPARSRAAPSPSAPSPSARSPSAPSPSARSPSAPSPSARRPSARRPSARRPSARSPTAPNPPRPGQAAIAEFERHVAAERGLSPHTVRGYVGDARSLLVHADQCGVTGPAELTAPILRSWLAVQHSAGASRATLARRGAAARSFTAFAHRQGWLATDPGTALGTPKVRRALPHVLRKAEIADALASCAADIEQPPPGGPRRRPPWPCATRRCWNSCTRPASGSAELVRAGPRGARPAAAGPIPGSWARATRNAPCR